MADLHKPTPEQRRGAWLTAAVLAGTAVAIYLVFMLKIAAVA
jgi:hypothetical protein